MKKNDKILCLQKIKLLLHHVWPNSIQTNYPNKETAKQTKKMEHKNRSTVVEAASPIKTYKKLILVMFCYFIHNEVLFIFLNINVLSILEFLYTMPD